MRKLWALVALATAIACGCASGEGMAQDKPGKPGEPKPADAPKKDAKDKEEKKPEKKFKAKIEDRYKTPAVTITDVVLFVPEYSIFGSSGGEASRELAVKQGGFDIKVPFEDIAGIDVGEEKEDRLDVSIRFKDPEKAGKALKGTVRSNLELKGTFEASTLKAAIKLREVKTLTLEEIPGEAPKPAGG